MFFDWGNPPISSTLNTAAVSNPSTATLVNEIDSTQLGTQNLAVGQSLNVQAIWIVGADTNASWVLEQANSTATAASTIVVPVKTPTAQSGQYVTYHRLGPNDRLRARLASTFTGSASAFIQAQILT